MNDTSRAQGWAICGGAGLAALLFIVGILNASYWAIAIPVAIITLFALGLVAWVGFTIATIQVETDAGPEILTTDEPKVASVSESISAEDAA
jgi:Zn-dependent membrane protease YugP